MSEPFQIAGYCRISVDEELDRDNTSIENQKSIIKDYVSRAFPGSNLTFYEDRDRSGYTFEQREGYQAMRPMLMNHGYDVLVIKDFSRFSRRNSRGLVELEDLRDAGLRIISIGDSIDYPTYDDWTAIQFRFLVNEMPVTDASKKVRSVIKRRQEDGKWICAVPYGYVITNSKTMTFEPEPTEAEVVREIFSLYNDGWGYKRIAEHLTDKHIPTPRMNERTRKEARGEDCKIKARAEWSIATVQGILQNDFYIGTLRQGKYTRKKINGGDVKREQDEHIVFENHHEAIVDYKTFAVTKQALKVRSTGNYRGVRKYDNVYSGLMECGDCGSPMFPMSRKDLKEAYRCGTYHRRGLKGCTSHHIRVDVLDEVLKEYLRKVRDGSAEMIQKLEKQIADESCAEKQNRETISILERQLADAKEELKVLIRQKTREVMRKPEEEAQIEETYGELIDECRLRAAGLENQIALTADKRNTIIRVNRIASTALGIFDEILEHDRLDKRDLELLVERIYVYEDHIHIKLKPDIECILQSGALPEENEEEAANFNSGVIGIVQTRAVQTSAHRPDKVYGVNVISSGEPLEIFTDKDGEVIFKKYSPIGEVGMFTNQFAEAINKSSGIPVAICDNDTIVAVAGVPKKDLLEKPISQPLFEAIERRQSYSCEQGAGAELEVTEDRPELVSYMSPIVAEGNVIGAVMSLQKQKGESPNDAEKKLISTGAMFLSTQMEV